MLLSNTFQVNSADNSEIQISAVENGAVSLYHNGSKKFETTSSGISVTGDTIGTGDFETTGTNKHFKSHSSSSGKWVRMYAAGGTGQWDIYGNGANLRFSDNASAGSVVFDRNVDANGGLDVTGNISVSGTVDGRDVATDGTKLDGIESGATADQSASEIVALIADQTIAPSEIDMEDNESIKLGAGDDLELKHNGSNSQIVNITGHLLIGSERIKLTNPAHGHVYLDATLAGSVDLYHNNSKKFETLSTGVLITGSDDGDGGAKGDFKFFQTDGTQKIMFDASAGNFEFQDDRKASFGGGDDLQIYHSSGENFIRGNGTVSTINIDSCHELKLRHLDTSGSNIENMIVCNDDSSVELYHNGSKKLETSVAGLSITGDVLPEANNSRDLGSSSLRWANLFVNDMHFANSPDNPNKVDGTWGDWTLQEGEDTIYMLNNRNGKKYKMNLTEV